MLRDGIARHTPTLTDESAVRLLVADTALLPHLGELIAQLTRETDWLEVGSPIDDVIAAAFSTITEFYNMTLIGMVNQFLGAVPPGWLALDGATHEKDDYPELHEILPSSLKTGTDFTLPDIADAFMFGTNTPAEIGDTGGSNLTTLTIAQLPAHTHSYVPPVVNIDLEAPGVPDILAAGIGAPTATGSTGSGEDIENRPQFIKVLFAVYAGRA
jgi:microcystin-dependent protein